MTVAIVIPTFNRVDFAQEAVASAMRQEGVSEVVIVDDCGSDGTSDRLDAMYGRDSRFLLIRQDENTGLSGARNRGFAHTSADWVLFLDDDDVLPPAAVQRMLSAATKSTVAVAGSRTIFGAETPRKLVPITSRPRSAILWPQVLAGWCPAPSQSLMRAEMVRDVGCWDESLPGQEDHKLWLDLAHRGPVTLLRESVVDYRYHPNQSAKGLETVPRQQRFREAFVSGLPASDRRTGEAALAVWRASWRALAARHQGAKARAVSEYLRMVTKSPALALSPELRNVVIRGVAGSLLGGSAPAAAVQGKDE